MWINVPKIQPTESQKAGKDRMMVNGLEGAVTDPIKLGFIVSDIRVVANKNFLSRYPKVKKLLELFKLPLQDISEQNLKLNQGEKSEADIQKHVDQWIKKNQKLWDSWIEEAKKA